MRPLAAALICTISFFGCFYLRGCKDEKKEFLDSMIKNNYFQGKYMGVSDKISPQWINYEALKKKFSENEIVDLCEHPNPVVRCYAFLALTDNCSQRVYEVLLKHLSDTAEFEAIYGCLADYDSVIENFLYGVGYDKSRYTKYSLTEDQYDHIDSILLFSEEIKQRADGGAKYRFRNLLQRTNPVPHIYNRIKELVANGVYEALPILAQYRNPNDTTIFKNLLLDEDFNSRGGSFKRYVRSSIKNFPDPSFYPILKAQLISEISTSAITSDFQSFTLYIALVQYPTRDTRELFEYALKNSGKEYNQRAAFIYYAVKKYPSKIFENLVKDIDVDERYSYVVD